MSLITLFAFLLIFIFFTSIESLSSKEKFNIYDLFDLFVCDIYETNEWRLVLVKPVNWIILNRLTDGKIFSIAEYAAGKCNHGTLLHQLDTNVLNMKNFCWGMEKSEILSMFENSSTESYTLKSSKIKTIYSVINELLDEGIIKFIQPTSIVQNHFETDLSEPIHAGIKAL